MIRIGTSLKRFGKKAIQIEGVELCVELCRKRRFFRGLRMGICVEGDLFGGGRGGVVRCKMV